MRIGVKITLLLVLVVATAMAIATTFSSLAISKAFSTYFKNNAELRLEEMASDIADYYQKNGWKGIDNVFMPGMGRGRGQGGMGMMRQFSASRIIVTDRAGRVVSDTLREKIGQYYEAESGVEVVPIMVDGEKVGALISATTTGKLEENFISSIKMANIKAGMLATILALIVGIYLSKKMSKPLVTLSEAAKKIANRELSHRVPVYTKDEIGEVGAAFNKMAESIEHNELLRKNLIADVAHELRTPLSILRGNLELLQEEIIEPAPEVFASLHEESIRISRLVEDLQSLSHADAGDLKFDFDSEDLAQVVRKVVLELKAEAAKKNIELCAEGATEIYVRMDQYRIGQVLYNLISNAIRYTEQGIVKITINDLPEYVQVEIKDSGTGIAEEYVPFLFDRFYRVEKSRNRFSGGSGLGLAIAKSFVEAHGGRIWVESKIGEGSNFIFSLPKEREQ
ncbi:MAG: HAMP domain-containing protein [Pelosinus sp.]|nr:HAMP domain-containing protein [Pelosinus sp.]